MPASIVAKAAERMRAMRKDPEMREKTHAAVSRAQTGRKKSDYEKSVVRQNALRMNATYWKKPENAARAKLRQKSTFARQLREDPNFLKKAQAGAKAWWEAHPEEEKARGRKTALILNSTYWKKPENAARAKERVRALNRAGAMLAGRAINRFEADVWGEMPLCVEYTGDGRWWRKLPSGKSINPDFRIPGTKAVIETFGEPWHPPSDEKQRIAEWESVGFRCLVIWNLKWRANREKEILRLRRFLASVMPS